MMQFSESATPPLHQNPLGLCLDLPPAAPTQPATGPPFNRPNIIPWPSKSAGPNITTTTLSSASCMEQLLVYCAHAVDRSDATLAHQLLWVLNTIAPPDGDSTQRLSSAFLRSLILRASRTGTCQLSLPAPADPTADLALHRFSPLDLATFVDLTPFHRFGYTAANAAIAEAAEGFPIVHIVDLSTTHCMQMPTLIDALASRPEGPPYIKLTVPCPPDPSSSISIPPLPTFSLDELGSRLVSFARSRNVGMEFLTVPSSPSDGFQTLTEQLRLQKLVSAAEANEALVINCQMLPHYIPDDSLGPLSLRSLFLKHLWSLEPNLVTLVDEDVDLTAEDVVGRLRAAFNYLWIPYDAVDTFLARGSEKRRWYEAEIGWKVENVVACEGMGRVERGEGRGRWAGRMRGAGFRGVGFGEEAAGEVKAMLDEHAAGWGLKREEDMDLVLTWKGHNVVFASAWVPAAASS